MQNINQLKECFSLGSSKNHDGLEMFPLLGSEPFAKDYLTLDEALRAGVATITEVSDSGSVPNLLFRNKGEQAVFLLDGEELVGAKQNRVLNITILAPALTDTVIPVSCVEAGRWSHSSPDFKSAARAQFSESRAKRCAQVSEDIERSKMRRSNQGEVWNDIDMKLSALKSDSPTRAVSSAFESHEDNLSGFVDRLQVIDNQFGAVFCVKGRVAGMELFDSNDTCRELMPKIVRSYALDAIDPRVAANESIAEPNAEALLDRIVRAKVQEADALGEGKDLRFSNESGLAGGALLARDRIVHLVAFARRERTMHSSERVYRRRSF